MYTRFFGLNRLPFEASPDPGFLFDGPAHREAIASIEYAVATRMGFIMLTGEVGLGKTTVIRAFLDRYDRQRLLPIYVFHPLLSFDELLQLVSDELGLRLSGGVGSFNRLRAIQLELIRLYEEQRQVILIIDEAQRLPEDTLENLRLLTNLETNEAKLLQIVLVGQPELDAVLQQPHLRQLEQRIVLKARLDNLTTEDSLRYLKHRLTLAGADKPEDVLTTGALKAVVELSGGVPRRMNVLANRTLIDAFGANEKPVSGARVRKVAAANSKQKPPVFAKWMRRAAALALVVGLAGGAGVATLWPAAVAMPQLANFAAMMHLPGVRSAAAIVPGTGKPAAAPTPAIHAEAATARPDMSVPPPTPPSAPPILAKPQNAAASEMAVPTGAASLESPPPAAQADRLPTAEPVPGVTMTSTALSSQPASFADEPSASKIMASFDHSNTSAAIMRDDTPYNVVPGDTLWKICLRVYGPDLAPSMISKVMSKNRISNGVKLLWGVTILLPSPRKS